MYCYYTLELWGYIGPAFRYENSMALYFQPPMLQGTIIQGALYSATPATLAT